MSAVARGSSIIAGFFGVQRLVILVIEGLRRPCKFTSKPPLQPERQLLGRTVQVAVYVNLHRHIIQKLLMKKEGQRIKNAEL